ncbi:alpha/beta fold hydrolase [Longimycelium tulufanense]|nr:alpha/beta hydrolase [Longimycelium tulufanense]
MEIRLGELTFDVLVGGPEDGNPVLLLHGFPETAQSWDLVTTELNRAGLRTIAPNQRGYSPGARPTDVDAYRMHHIVGDALGILDALNIQSAHVVGHDWGAVVAWSLAIGQPDRVRSLVAISVPHPNAFSWAYHNDPDQQERSWYISFFRQEGKAEEKLLADDAQVLRRAFDPLPDERIAPHLAAMREPGALTAALNWYRASNLDEVSLPPVEVPTTYVWSDGDRALGPAGAMRCGDHVTGPYRAVELAGVSHWIPDERPDAVVEAVLDRVG